ncbi:hypothetical protein FB381_3443 [Nocardioides albertanoniae]|uniref:MYXO-CTERM domain-containing protein n=1 Tax=Nocardioides albertanoniae TaxID=1175486 RepID=A0A543AAA4_9ACTN|nr:hypothetical protein [Nocardioides albertanoniae]TQL69533.1 hypothetical protein FB381_3443 [Nocardioides albertanoniae]
MLSVRSLVALAVLAGATALFFSPALPPAAASTADACDGVTVVVEPRALGGAPEVDCVRPEEGDTGADVFEKAGHRLTFVTSMPSVVCRVDERPKAAGCAQMPPADAYWSLWVTDESGAWSYASRNVTEIAVTSGQGVAFTWIDDNVVTAPATELGSAVGAPSSPSPELSPDDAAESEPESEQSSPKPLPAWVAPTGILALFAAAGVVWWRRR